MNSLAVAILLCLVSCGNAKKVITQIQERVDVRERTEFVPVIVKVDIPEVRLERTTRDTMSHLETPFSMSDAIVHRDGTLEHTLMDIPQTIEKEIETKIVYKDSIIYKERIEEKEVPVEKKLSWWQKTRLDAFWVLIALIAWAYRKYIIKLIGLI